MTGWVYSRQRRVSESTVLLASIEAANQENGQWRCRIHEKSPESCTSTEKGGFLDYDGSLYGERCSFTCWPCWKKVYMTEVKLKDPVTHLETQSRTSLCKQKAYTGGAEAELKINVAQRNFEAAFQKAR